MENEKLTHTETKRDRMRLIKTGENTKPENLHKGLSAPDTSVDPPDGGWGWMVVMSSFLIHVIADGIVYSFGIFLMEFVVYFKAGRGAASWVGSLQPAVTFTIGPLASALTNQYGCRRVTIAGAAIASSGFVMSAWAPNLFYLYFTSGIIPGIGFGLIYLPAIVCVAQYFKKRRSFATGLAVCGSGFGTFILAPITEMLVNEFSWQGAMLILGGVILNVVFCGFIFRPLPTEVVPSRQSSCELETDVFSRDVLLDNSMPQTDRSMCLITTADCVNEPENEVKCKGHRDEVLLKTIQDFQTINTSDEMKFMHTKKKTFSNDKNSGNSNNSMYTPESKENNISSTASGTSSTVLDKQSYSSSLNSENIVLQGSDSLLTSHSNLSVLQHAQSDSILERRLTTQDFSPREVASAPELQTNGSSESPSYSLNSLSHNCVLYTGSLRNTSRHKFKPCVNKMTVVEITSEDTQSTSEKSDTKVNHCVGLPKEFHNTMKNMLSLTLLKNPVFLMFAISNFFTGLGFNMPFIFLPDRAKLAGIDESSAALLLSVIGIANTAGRITFGFISDCSWVNRLMLYNTALAVCGVITALSPLFGSDYGLLLTYAAIFGVFIGVYVSLTSIVLVDLLGIECLTNAFGLLLLFQGVATFVGPPVAGWLCDWTGSYDVSFIMMGSLIALSGVMLYFLPLVEHWYVHQLPSLIYTVSDLELEQQPVNVEDADIISLGPDRAQS